MASPLPKFPDSLVLSAVDALVETKHQHTDVFLIVCLRSLCLRENSTAPSTIFCLVGWISTSSPRTMDKPKQHSPYPICSESEPHCSQKRRQAEVSPGPFLFQANSGP
jgi:hypothetical protein